MVNKNIKKLYGEYPKEIQEFMNNIHLFIQKKFGAVNNEWIPTLLMLADNLDTFFRCKNQINKDGLMITDRFGSLVKHPLIKTQTDSQIQIVKLLNEFALTPKAVLRLNLEEDNEDDFLDNLTK